MSGFEEWRSTKHRFTSLDQAFESAWEAGFAAGVQAERERCARIAEADIQDHAITISAAQQETHNNCCRYIAAAIRGRDDG